MNVVALTDATIEYLTQRGCFLVELDKDSPLDPQLDRAAVQAAQIRTDRTSLKYHAALISLANKF